MAANQFGLKLTADDFGIIYAALLVYHAQLKGYYHSDDASAEGEGESVTEYDERMSTYRAEMAYIVALKSGISRLINAVKDETLAQYPKPTITENDIAVILGALEVLHLGIMMSKETGDPFLGDAVSPENVKHLHKTVLTLISAFSESGVTSRNLFGIQESPS